MNVTQGAPSPVFVSYAREDVEVVRSSRRASRVLSSTLWYDLESIDGSDPHWRDRIDKAIRSSSAVIVLCSPAARTSRSVTAEVEIAFAYGKMVHCLWIAGNDWALSAPFSLVASNYVDARAGADHVRRAMEDIVDTVIRDWPIAITRPPCDINRDIRKRYLITVTPRSHLITEAINQTFVNPAACPSMKDLVNGIYEAFAFSYFEPLSYGRDWWLQIADLQLLPAAWVRNQGVAAHRLSSEWWAYGPKELGIEFGSALTLIDARQRCDHGTAYIGVFGEAHLLDFFLSLGRKVPYLDGGLFPKTPILNDREVAALEARHLPQFVIADDKIRRSAMPPRRRIWWKLGKGASGDIAQTERLLGSEVYFVSGDSLLLTSS